MSKLRELLNAATRRLEVMFPGYFPEAKHNHYADFGWPEHLSFPQLFAMYSRNGLARAGVDKTVLKTWQDMPFLLEKPRDGSQGKGKNGKKGSEETPLEAELRKQLAKIRFWQNVAEADRRSLVGRYSGLILRFGDNQPFNAPVGRVKGGIAGLIEVIPAWEGQLTVSEWFTDQQDSDNYGKPKQFIFNESQIGGQPNQAPRQLTIHPDRVLVWSRDGTVNASSLLEPGYNHLLDMEKIVGAGGEGFWKNAKSAPVIEVDKDASLRNMAAAMGVPETEVVDSMNEQVADWQKGFDKLLMLQGMQAKTLGITLPSPEHFFAIALQCFAASIMMPVKILVGSQTGERASTEDANEWNQTIKARRENYVVPLLMALIERMVKFGLLPVKDWTLDWSDLTEASMAEKIDRADKMAGVNAKMAPAGELVFTSDEIREVVDLEPLSDADKYVNDQGAADAAAAAGVDPQGAVQ